MKYDYTSIGFYTFDCLGRPVTHIPPNGDTYLIEELTMAVSGAAGAAAVVAAKNGLSVQAVGGVGYDDMGDWVLAKLASFNIDIAMMQRCEGIGTSSSIVTTRPDGQRPALHMKGATGAFDITQDMVDDILDSSIVHIGGVGLMDTVDGPKSFELFREAKKRGCITTLDVFAATSEDLLLVEGLLPNTDYFMPSIEEAQALTGKQEPDDIADCFISMGVECCVITLGELGAYYHHRNGTRFYSPAYNIDVVCTCGCGDAFNAGFATALNKEMEPELAVRFAQACSALNATGLGSQAGVVDFKKTLEFTLSTATH
ncbi:MAG: carbohydrate kinase family protein [Granulosicoccus sp.]